MSSILSRSQAPLGNAAPRSSTSDGISPPDVGFAYLGFAKRSFEDGRHQAELGNERWDKELRRSPNRMCHHDPFIPFRERRCTSP